MNNSNITQPQISFIGKHWKKGSFYCYDITFKDKDQVLKFWERLGVITKLSIIEYQINREIYLNLFNYGGDQLSLSNFKN